MTAPERIAKGLYWDEAWSLVSGCTPVSPGCDNCWSATETHMRRNNPNEKIRLRNDGLTEAGKFFGRIRLNRDFLDKPLRKKAPTTYAVWNDLFHEDVPFTFVDEFLAVVALAKQHTIMVLTKRPERMQEYFNHWFTRHKVAVEISKHTGRVSEFGCDRDACNYTYPLPNLWLGVTAENQEQADKRIPILLQIPAAVRWVSVEPMLEPMSLGHIQFDRHTSMNVLEGCGISLRSHAQTVPNAFCEKLNWIVCGGESGPGARPMHPEWARNLRDQCQAAGVPYFFKQWGEWHPMEDYKDIPLSYHSKEFRVISLQGKDETKMPIIQMSKGVAGMSRVGKKMAGRLFDGVEWSEFPKTL